MTTVLYLKASNDINGNPRRGWLVIGPDFTRWVEEGGEGTGALKRFNPELLELDWTEIHISASEYRRLRREYR